LYSKGENIVYRIFKKILFLVLIFSMLASVIGISQTAVATGVTLRTTDRVNLRTEPSTESSTIAVVNKGTNVEVLEHNPAGWSKVQVGGSTGYIRSDFLTVSADTGTATFRTTDGVNVRAAASTDSSVVMTVAAGTSVEVTEHDPTGWSKVRVGGNNGFIRSDFLTRGGSGAATTAGTTPAASSSETAIATLRTNGTVNIRAGASTDTNIIRTLASGTSVEVLENQSNGWSRVRHNGTVGFIRSDLLSDTGASPAQAATTLRTIGSVNMRSGPSTSNSVIRTLASNTSVEVLSRSNGWSSVRHNGTAGYIRSDFLSESGASSGSAAIGTLRTVTGVNFRSGPSTNNTIIRLLPANTGVEVLENQANGWSKVRHDGTEGFIRSDLLGTGARTVELIDWSVARNTIPTGVNLRVVDVRTGISFNLRGFAKTGHLDVEPPTQADTDAIFRTRNGVWSWAARPVWVTVGDRTYAAALNGMPHDVSTIRDNGMNGHLCLHFGGTVTNSQSYQRDLRNAVTEAYNARPQ